ncbi:hypothetical protein [Thalassoroseus pseudoceratinae]|uniref:hypothetical protein n=1 Tax=Thalassoroseus pseudoceratinae TaxID=2713176 RepID=UPI00141F3A45|nr:hypothetical protein [Thalassoroseus pseudoceratinae]
MLRPEDSQQPSGFQPPESSKDQPIGEDQRAIARFTNAADAGFFAHELSLTTNVPIDVRCEDDYDAVSGHWSIRFLLCGPAKEASQLSRTLQKLIEQSADDEPTSLRTPPVRNIPADQPISLSSRPVRFAKPDTEGAEFWLEDREPGVNWLPIVLTLAAGSLVFWGWKKLQEPQKVPAANPRGNILDETLWERLSLPPGEIWIQQDEFGRRVRELKIDRDRRGATLREDLDGDSLFERSTRLRRPATR